MRPTPADLDVQRRLYADSHDPVDLDALARALAVVQQDPGSSAMSYAPGARFEVGERVWYRDELVEVAGVRSLGNPVQGSFSVLDLRTPDGIVLRAVAEVHGAAQVGTQPDEPYGALSDSLSLQVSDARAAALSSPRAASLVADRVGAQPWSTSPGSSTPSPSLFRARSVDAHAIKSQEDQAGRAAIPFSGEVAGNKSDTELCFEELQAAFLSVREGSGAAEVWQGLVLPALVSLGWAPVGLPDGVGYALYPDANSRDSAVSRADQGIPLARSARALILATGWAAPLGRQSDASDLPSPALQLVGRLLSDHVAWGVLTNGQEWRLYGASSGDPDLGGTMGTSYRINLAEVFDSVGAAGDTAAARQSRLQRWLSVFRADAFEPDSRGLSPVDGLKQEASAYARTVVRRLRRELLEAILPDVAGGFIVYRAAERGAGRETDETLEEIGRASLGLVYRLLFVLYAEHHQLLPLGNPDYRGQSLTTQLRWAMACRQDARPLSRATHTTPRYDALLALFHNLEHGMPSMGLPGYSGGLFSPVDRDVSFLMRHRLSDRVVARTLAALGSIDGEPVDYTVVTVRHLTAVGEGLLENFLWVVEASAGQVALVSARGEPQAPSSVPIPDFVGVSVIERAIESTLQARERAFAAAMDRVTALRRGQVEALSQESALIAAEQEACDALLGVKVLDPAMGAGTFLIYAIDDLVDGIARALVTYHRDHPWVRWSWNPIIRQIATMRHATICGAARQGVAVDPDLLEDDAILARLVAERAIYGVDLSQTAVALARAGVSMRAFVVGAPFVHLDAHMRRGDSLLGLRVADLPDTVLMRSFVVGISALNPACQSADYPVDPEPYEAVLDLWLSEGQGNAGAQDLLRRLGSRALPAVQGLVPLNDEDVETLRRARDLGTERGFLHWDIAFPEVFLRANGLQGGQAGFDVVVGSPPSPHGAGEQMAFAAGEGAFRAQGRRLVQRPAGRVAFVVTPSNRA